MQPILIISGDAKLAKVEAERDSPDRGMQGESDTSKAQPFLLLILTILQPPPPIFYTDDTHVRRLIS